MLQPFFETVNEGIISTRTNSMFSNSPSWEANSTFRSQEIPCILWNLKVHYSVRKSPPPSNILSQINSIHTPKPNFPMIHFNNILPPMPRSSEWLLLIRFYNRNVSISHRSHPCYMLSPSHSPWFYYSLLKRSNYCNLACMTILRETMIYVSVTRNNLEFT